MSNIPSLFAEERLEKAFAGDIGVFDEGAPISQSSVRKLGSK